MDGPNSNKNNDAGQLSRAEHIRNAKAAIDERRQRAINNRQQFGPQIHEQIQRLFQEYEAPFYASLRGFGKSQTLALAESTVLSLAAVNDRGFEDSETQALTEHFLSSVHNLLAWKWAMTGMAAYITYRGRRTWRFPFFTPEFKKFSPIGASPAIKYVWHSARFAAYYGTLWIMGEPVFQGANFMRQRSAMERDPRLRSLLRDGKAQSSTLLGGRPEASDQGSDAWGSASQPETKSSSQSPQAQSSWASFRTPTQPQPPVRSDSWDSTPDNVDDASPVVPSVRGQPTGNTNDSGSAWDRIRQQSQYQPNQQDQKSWERPQSGGEWGHDADTNPQYEDSRDSYSFSKADEEKGRGWEQEQREFDRLLERERSGVDQERSSWNKR